MGNAIEKTNEKNDCPNSDYSFESFPILCSTCGWDLLRSGDIPLLMKILLIVVPSGLIVLMVYLLIERVNEIKEDDDDDLSQY